MKALRRGKDVLMRIVAQLFVTGVVLVAGGCVNRSGLAGKWQGYVTENDKSTLVQLELRGHGDSIEGTFTILGDTGQDIAKGRSFEIVDTRRCDNKVEFIVPISGEVDDDAVAFELNISKERLTGYGHELAEGSANIPVTLIKQH